MLPALTLAAALATPTPAALPTPTPPPEPNHVTLAGIEGFVLGSGEGRRHWNGYTSEAWGLYEFQAGPHLRFADSLHWERFSSHFTASFLGTTFAAPFDFDEYDDQLDVELGRPWLPTGVGIGYYDYSPVYDVVPYHLAGFGFGVDHWANWYVVTSPYYSVWYYPDLTSAASAGRVYGIARADVGVNFRRSLVSPWGVQIGVQDDSWFGQNARSPSLNFLEPYVRLTWWQ